MTIVCNIWMICLILNWFVYDPSWMLHLSEFVRTLRSSVVVVFNNFLLLDSTDRIKIRSDQKRFFIALSIYPLSFFGNTPFNTPPPLFLFKYSCHPSILPLWLPLPPPLYLQLPRPPPLFPSFLLHAFYRCNYP